MKKAIWIFVSRNEKPDLYINILGHCLNRFGKDVLHRAFLLKIIDSSIDKDEELQSLFKLRDNISRQIDGLSMNQYFQWDWNVSEFHESLSPKRVSVENNWSKIYKSFQGLLKNGAIEVRTILEENIEVQLSEIIRDEKVDHIFDITGVITRHMLRVSLVLLAKRKSIYAFEMHKKLVHNDEDLIHTLKSNDYDYHKLDLSKYSVIPTLEYAYKNEAKSSEIQEFAVKDTIDALRQELRSLLAKGNLFKVIDKILEINDLDGSVKDQVVLLGARLKHINNLFNGGKVVYEVYNKEMNGMRYELLSIIADL